MPPASFKNPEILFLEFVSYIYLYNATPPCSPSSFLTQSTRIILLTIYLLSLQTSIMTTTPLTLERFLDSSSNTRQHYPYPPPILTKHAVWFLPKPDLFISIRGLLYGLHQGRFLPHSEKFREITSIIEPCRTSPRGLTPTLPIPLDSLEELYFNEFLLLLYQPDDFHGTDERWKRIYRLASHWGFRHVQDQAWIELQYLSFLRLAPGQKQIMMQRTPPHIRELFWRRFIRNPPIIVEESDIEMEQNLI